MQHVLVGGQIPIPIDEDAPTHWLQIVDGLDGILVEPHTNIEGGGIRCVEDRCTQGRELADDVAVVEVRVIQPVRRLDASALELDELQARWQHRRKL